MNIALVSSTDFFKAFCSFLENKVDGNSILNKIISNSGVIDLSEFEIFKQDKS